MTLKPLLYLFFFNDTATTEIYTLSLHDALPISGPRGAARRRLRADRPVVGELDGADPTMSRAGRLLAIGAVALVASAHVGSPDTYYEGSAGPYAVRVIVRNPGVVPGLAQITVRLLGPPAPRAVHA